MSPDDLRLTAQLVAAGRVHVVTDESVMALARRVLELEAREAQLLDAVKANHQKASEEATLRARAEADLADAEQHKTALAQSLEQMTAALDVALDAVRAVGVTVERREDGMGWAVTNTRAVEAEAVEREACAKACDEAEEDIRSSAPSAYTTHQVANAARGVAAAIRARGAK